MPMLNIESLMAMMVDCVDLGRGVDLLDHMPIIGNVRSVCLLAKRKRHRIESFFSRKITIDCGDRPAIYWSE